MIDSITEVEYDFRFKVNIALGCIAQTSAFPISKPARTFSYEQYLSLLRKGDWEKQRDRERDREGWRKRNKRDKVEEREKTERFHDFENERRGYEMHVIRSDFTFRDL